MECETAAAITAQECKEVESGGKGHIRARGVFTWSVCL